MASEPLNELASVRVLLACLAVMLNPLIWNSIVRFEYRTRAVSRLCGGARPAVLLLGPFIMGMNFLRTALFRYMAAANTRLELLENNVAVGAGYLLVGVGTLLVLSSAWRLGYYNTFLGDYFGILMDARVAGFPFNVVNDPMYLGAVMIYVGDAVLYASVVALLLSLSIGLSYFIAAKFEGQYTAQIYAHRDKQI